MKHGAGETIELRCPVRAILWGMHRVTKKRPLEKIKQIQTENLSAAFSTSIPSFPYCCMVGSGGWETIKPKSGF